MSMNMCVRIWIHMDMGFSVYIWRKRNAAGSPSVTEKLFEAFAFDVCPTTQHDVLLRAVGLLAVWWQKHFCAALSFPAILKLKLIANFCFISFSLPVTCWHSGRMLV